MNALTGYGQEYIEIDEKEKMEEKTTIGEVLAISLVSSLTVVIFIVSTWSAVSLLTGNTGNGGPIGLLVNLMRTTGIV